MFFKSPYFLIVIKLSVTEDDVDVVVFKLESLVDYYLIWGIVDILLGVHLQFCVWNLPNKNILEVFHPLMDYIFYIFFYIPIKLEIYDKFCLNSFERGN